MTCIPIVELWGRDIRAPKRVENGVLAVGSGAGVLLCDDKLTRRMAEAEGLRPMGTLGVLLRAMQQRLISPHEAHTLLDRLVESHDFRIGIGVYQAAIGAISKAQ